MVVWRNREKFEEAVAQGVCDDELRWRPVGVHGAQPTAKLSPYAVAETQREVLKKSLRNAGQLNIDVVGFEFSFDCASVLGRLVVDFLAFVVVAYRRHRLHPKVIGVSADDVQRLAKTDFDFESIPVKGDDIERAHGGVGTQQEQHAAGWMDDDDETSHASNGSPKQVDALVGQLDAAFAVNGAGGGDEGGGVLCQVA